MKGLPSTRSQPRGWAEGGMGPKDSSGDREEAHAISLCSSGPSAAAALSLRHPSPFPEKLLAEQAHIWFMQPMSSNLACREVWPLMRTGLHDRVSVVLKGIHFYDKKRWQKWGVRRLCQGPVTPSSAPAETQTLVLSTWTSSCSRSILNAPTPAPCPKWILFIHLLPSLLFSLMSYLKHRVE